MTDLTDESPDWKHMLSEWQRKKLLLAGGATAMEHGSTLLSIVLQKSHKYNTAKCDKKDHSGTDRRCHSHEIIDILRENIVKLCENQKTACYSCVQVTRIIELIEESLKEQKFHRKLEVFMHGLKNIDPFSDCQTGKNMRLEFVDWSLKNRKITEFEYIIGLSWLTHTVFVPRMCLGECQCLSNQLGLEMEKVRKQIQSCAGNTWEYAQYGQATAAISHVWGHRLLLQSTADASIALWRYCIPNNNWLDLAQLTPFNSRLCSMEYKGNVTIITWTGIFVGLLSMCLNEAILILKMDDWNARGWTAAELASGTTYSWFQGDAGVHKIPDDMLSTFKARSLFSLRIASRYGYLKRRIWRKPEDIYLTQDWWHSPDFKNTLHLWTADENGALHVTDRGVYSHAFEYCHKNNGRTSSCWINTNIPSAEFDQPMYNNCKMVIWTKQGYCSVESPNLSVLNLVGEVDGRAWDLTELCTMIKRRDNIKCLVSLSTFDALCVIVAENYDAEIGTVYHILNDWVSVGIGHNVAHIVRFSQEMQNKPLSGVVRPPGSIINIGLEVNVINY